VTAMKLSNSTAIATILFLFVISVSWLSWMSPFGLVPIAVTVLFCVPSVIRNFGKLLKECFREEIKKETMNDLKERMREAVRKKKTPQE
jgi:hypothetical protein